MTSHAARTRRENVGAGIFLMLTTMMWFLVLDTIAKELLTRAGLPLVQVVWARFFFHFLIGTAFILFLWPRRVHSQKPGLQLVRSALLLSTTALFNAGLSHSSLATATTIMFLTPIVLTVLSVFVLGEHVGPRRWLGVAFGFLGALIVVRPGMEGFNAGTLYFLAAAATNSAYQLTTRQLSGFDDPRTSFFYTAMVGTVGSSLAVPFAWETPDAFEWTLLVGMGLIGGIGHLFLVLAFDKAPASALAPFSYSALVWAALFGFVFFDEIPDFWTMVGAGLITGSGLYIFYRERVVQRQAIPARG